MNVTIGDKKTFDDWGLKLQSLVVSMPEAKTNYVDVPGSDGSMDLTEALGTVRYNNRELQMMFDVVATPERWHSLTSDIANYLHGQCLKVILDTAPNYYYIGRLSLDSSKSDYYMNHMTITGNMEPYKYEVDDHDELKNISVAGSKTVTIEGDIKPVSPVITSSAPMTVQFRAESYQLEPGMNRVYDIEIARGSNLLLFLGTGTVSIEYRGGRL